MHLLRLKSKSCFSNLAAELRFALSVPTFLSSDAWYDGPWDVNYFNDELYAWYGDHENYWGYGDDQSDDWHESGWQESGWTDGEVPEAEQPDETKPNAETQEFFKGKGKGHGGRSPLMGLGCRTCGSK